jgi:hypothetical protein
MGKNLFIRMAFTLAELGGIDKSATGVKQGGQILMATQKHKTYLTI